MATVELQRAAAAAALGDELADQGRFAEAVASYERALAAWPDHAALHYNRGLALQALGRLDEAVRSYDHAIQVKPDYARAYVNRGNALGAMWRLDEAMASYEHALLLQPDMAEAYLNRGVSLLQQGCHDEALRDLSRAVRFNANLAAAHHNLGAVLAAMNRLAEAVSSYERALTLAPDYAEAHEGRAHVLRDLGQYEAAIEGYERALACNPKLEPLRALRRHVMMRICAWDDFEGDAARIASLIAAGCPVMPFAVLALTDSAAIHRAAAQNWVRAHCVVPTPLPPPAAPVKRAGRERLRVAYFSSNFHEHPVARLVVELIEIHDRTRFEIIGISTGPDTADEISVRLKRGFDRFVAVRGQSDRDIALLTRRLEIDLAVDLDGFTDDGRVPRILAHRAAPIQIGYLGYLGTTAADFMDYLIADRTLVPDVERDHYTEKIVYLASYQANDSKRLCDERRVTRAELGLPATGFVYCCCNATYKITPIVFESWMRILQSVPQSVLLLYAGSDAARSKLRHEAWRRGVDPGRLVFCGMVPPAEYLSRFRAADLFLDTLPYNAGATASDALWAGLPVLTRIGRSFPGRMAASLLTAVGLPELITSAPEQYERAAIELALQPERLAAIREKLARNATTTRLFDSRRFAANIEAAYQLIHARYRAGLPPADIDLSAGS